MIVGKGALVGTPLSEILTKYPYNGTVITCDIFTEDLDKITKEADNCYRLRIDRILEKIKY